VNRQVGRIIGLQILVTAVISLFSLAIWGATVAASAFAGGAIGFSSSLAYAAGMSVPPGSDPRIILMAQLRGEILKLALTVILFAAVLILFKGISTLPMLLTFIATLSVYWAALLIV